MSPEASPRSARLRLALVVVSLTRLLVPRRRRAAWLAEWRGELHYLDRARGATGPALPTDVLSHSLHAIPHAAAHRRHNWSPEMLLQDLRYAVRRLRRAPGFALVAMFTVAIGVGANAAMYSVVNSTLINPLPYPNAERLVYLWKQPPTMDLLTTPSVEDVVQWREQATSFDEIHIYEGAQLTLTGGDEPRELIGLRILPGFFAFLGVQPSLGREFADDGVGDSNVVVVSHGLWQSHFGGADDVLGKAITLDGERHTVVGVMPSDFHFQAPFDDTQLWLPMPIDGDAAGSAFAIGRLAEGIGYEAANDELAAIAAAGEDGAEAWPGKARRPQDLHGDNFRTSLLALQAAVALVLLIACANVANLLLARGTTQRAEMAMRAAIGASRGRLFRQLLTEHLLLAIGGGVLGFALAQASVATIARLRPPELSGLATVRVDPQVFLFAVGVAAFTGVLFGILPAWQASRTDLATRLSGLGKSVSSARRAAWLRGGLVAGEVALAMVLLVGAGLMIGTLSRLASADLGFDTRNVLSMSVSLPESRYPEATHRQAFREQLEERVRRVAGDDLENLAYASGSLPTLGLVFGNFVADGQEPQPAFTNAAMHAGWVSPGFLATLGMTLLDGRDFTADDADDPSGPVIVNASFARKMWGSEEVIDERLSIGSGRESRTHTVVGVVADAKLAGPTGGFSDDHMFFPQSSFSSVGMLLRSRSDPLALLPAFKEQVWAIDPELPVEASSLDDAYARRLAAQRFNVVSIGIFAAVAVILALIGVYGVLSYAVGQRTREIGIRIALGASRASVLPMVAWQGLRMVLVGTALGALGAASLTRFIDSLLYGVSAVDPVTYVLVGVLLVGVAGAACFIPALRASRLDAMEALRQ